MGTDYNHRVDECQVAAWLLQEMAQGDVSSLQDVRLCDIDMDTYERYKGQLPGRFGRRAEHYFAENERVREGIGHWRRGDLVAFGELMTASGRSSIDYYECGSDELTTDDGRGWWRHGHEVYCVGGRLCDKVVSAYEG